MNLLGFGKQALPSVIKDPFSKTKITKILVSFSEKTFSKNGEWQATAWVTFKNGNTTGEQRFTADTFDDVVRQIKAMIETM